MQEKKINIFVIRLPLTYLNAVEAQSHFNIPPQNSILIILYRDIEYVDIRHIKKLLDTSQWREIHYLPYNVPTLLNENGVVTSNPLTSQILRTRYIKTFVSIYENALNRYNDVIRVFIGDYHIPSMRHIVNCVEPHQTILLDEGFNVYRVHKRLKNKNESQGNVAHFFRRLQHKLYDTFFGYKMYDLNNLTFFTSYQLGSTSEIPVITNTYDAIRKNINTQQHAEYVYFVGQSLSEIGAMEEDIYLKYLKKIARWFLPKKVIYIPHRGDAEEKLNRIQTEIGLTVKNLDMPIEYELCSTTELLPAAIAGFNSSALQNIDNIFKNSMPIFSFYIEPNEISAKKRDMYCSYSEYLKTLSSSTFSVVHLPTDKVDNTN
ncbi:hypothetical protein [Desulforhopalus sp. IMCC35007]|uniref:hypothetical protein n=1 Tax=Desulforhopalus sp. IMCC35007 TaxID=2569543 RepID=UPI0010AE3730|nr:hypothetical protein [Desulforhopalus sp. IMCC35007]TKB05600.1 hypothetical protein FCL48_24335 [Desulforhopalus sp. IMCC35007]